MSYPIESKRRILKAMRKISDHHGDAQEARRKIIERAKEINAEYIIPANWNEDGTIK